MLFANFATSKLECTEGYLKSMPHLSAVNLYAMAVLGSVANSSHLVRGESVTLHL